MRNKRTFSVDFKRQVVEELLSGESGAAPPDSPNPICPIIGVQSKLNIIISNNKFSIIQKTEK
jgi:hypothetical protein